MQIVVKISTKLFEEREFMAHISPRANFIAVVFQKKKPGEILFFALTFVFWKQNTKLQSIKMMNFFHKLKTIRGFFPFFSYFFCKKKNKT